ncbi:Pentapeptide repeats (9 copies) [uncultured archaeon]|nr:Pentapeptide repeats (9 copies) [uncultured archaeon]
MHPWALVLMALFLMVASAQCSNEPMQTVSADEIRGQIVNGEPFWYDRAIIEGDLNISNLNIDTPIHITNSVMNWLDAENSTFNKNVDFSGTTFHGSAILDNSRFNEDVDFSNTVFDRLAYFYMCNFNNRVAFENSTMHDEASFFGSTFWHGANFGKSCFFDKFNIHRSIFYEHASFSSTTFNRTADFRWTRFNSYADFDQSRFRNLADFGWSLFLKYAIFKSCNFEGVADFTGSNFDSWSFERANFNGDAIFQQCRFDSIYLAESNFNGEANFRNIHSNNTIGLWTTRIDDFIADWSDVKGDLFSFDTREDKKEIYRKLKIKYEANGLYNFADECAYQLKVTELEDEKDPIYYIFNFSSRVLYGWGYKPLYPVVWSAAIIILFGILWHILGLNKPNLGPEEYNFATYWTSKAGSGGIKRYLQALSFSANVFLSGTKFFVDPPDIPKMHERSMSLIKCAFTLERILGALFSILLLLALSKTIIR